MPEPIDPNQTQRFDSDRTRIISPREGLRVFQHYFLKRQLGAGGMGEVWLAHDEQLDEQVALKFVLPSVRADKGAIDLLKQEVRTAHALSHPNIVRVHSYLEDEALAAISMEFVEGHCLDELRHKEPNHVFEAKTLYPWARQLCDALDYAHGIAGVVHRDLKPKNLMVDRKGFLKVMDFGISAVIAATTARSSRVVAAEKSAEAVKGSGTCSYMSPQQFDSRKPTPGDDLYALGVTFYELLTGTTPFTQADMGALIYAVMNTKPVTMTERRADYGISGAPIPESWEFAVAACLAKKSENRPQSAKEVWEIIEGRESSGVSDATMRVRGSAHRGQDSGSRKRIPLGTIAAGALACVLIASGVWWFGFESPKRARLAEEKAQIEQAQKIERERVAALAKKAEEERQAEQTRLAAEKREADRLAADKAQQEALRLANARGGLIVRTSPSGAEVRVAGMEISKSPVTVKESRIGKFPVHVRLGGYDDWDGEIEVKENDFAEIDVALVRSTGTLNLTSEPSGLSYELIPDSSLGLSRRIGRTPLSGEKLPTGSYTVQVTRNGWPSQGRQVQINKGTPASLAFDFAGGELQIESEPRGAEVYANGGKIGTTPLRLSEQVPGAIELEYRLKGHKTTKVVREIKPHQVEVAAVTLEVQRGPELGVAITIPDLNLVMMPISAGSFTMGSDNEKGGESPLTQVTFTQPFWLGKTEVTQLQWEAVMGSNPSLTKGADLPVAVISWNDAMSFCGKLTQRERAAGRLPEGYEYALPTEAQWEYACRAGTSGHYAGDLELMGWYSGNQPHPVGQKQANAWGLYDMHGNLWEWCADWYGRYPGGSVQNPRGPSRGTGRVMRGGSHFFGSFTCRSASRGMGDPTTSNFMVGFRVALRTVP